MNRGAFIALIIIIATLMSGCVEVDYIIEFDRDENVKYTLTAKIDKNMVKSKEEVEQYIQDNFYKNLEEAKRPPFAYTYDIFETENHYIFELTSPLQTLHPLNFGDGFGVFAEDIKSSSNSKRMDIIFYSSQEFKGKISIPQSRSDGYLVLNHIKDNDVDIKVIVKSSSFRLINHNADKVSNDGKLLKWNINPLEVNEITFGYVKNRLYQPAIIIILLIGVVWIRKKKGRNFRKSK